MSASIVSFFSSAIDKRSKSLNLAMPETLKTAKGIDELFFPLSIVLIISKTVRSKS